MMTNTIPISSASAKAKLSRLNKWSLLLTKLWCPLLPDELIERDAIVNRRLNTSGHWCILGSAGYGKTTLASIYCHTGARNYGWLTLDVSDNNPERFSRYLAAAFISACPSCDHLRELLEVQESFQLNQIITSILNEALLVQHPIDLVLDDYHLIENKDIHTSISMLLNSASENLKIILVSRLRPPLSFSSLQMQGRIHFTGVEDLAFNHEKSVAYLQLICPEVATESIAPVLYTIEGWPAGLRSLGLFLANTDHPPSIISESNLITSSAISDYFWEQVLEKLPAELQKFLLYTSIFDSFNVELCEVVLGHAYGLSFLDEIMQRQLFITSLGEDKKWFRYHNLFHIFLIKQLQAEPKELVENLHKRATDAWLTHNNVVNALKHALATSDFDCISRALLHPQQALLSQGNGILLEQAILRLPMEYICRQPSLTRLACSFWLNRDQEKVLQLIEIASVNLNKQSDTPAVRHAHALFKLYRAQVAIIRDRVSEIISWSELALKDLLETDLASRSQAFVLLAEGYTRLGDIHLAKINWQQGELLAQRADNFSMVGWARHQRAMIALHEGDFTTAQILQDKTISFVASNCVSGDKNLWCLHRARAETAWEYFDLEGVELHCHKALDVCRHWLQNGEIPIEIIHARTQLLLGQQSQTYAHLQCALDLFKTVPCCAYVASFLYLAQAEFHLRFSAKSALTQLLHTLIVPKYYRNDIAQRIGRSIAICYFGLGDIERAINIFVNMNHDAEQFSLITEKWRNSVWLVACYLSQARQQEAVELLNDCVNFAADRGLIGSLLLTAPYLESLFDMKVGHSDLAKRHWRRVRDLCIHSRAHVYKDQQIPKAITALAITPKEWRVFQLVLAGAGNEEVAARLNLSLGTVKNTLTRVYRKLDVNDRESACRVAQNKFNHNNE